MPRRKLVNKIAKKRTDKKCYFCFCNEYALLDLHRIIEGCQGGDYSEFNTVTVCSNCHRRIHADVIKIDRKYRTSDGRWKLHFWESGEEKWQYPPE